MKWYKKKFNILSKAQQKIIDEQAKSIEVLFDKQDKEFDKETEKGRDAHIESESKCPNCDSKEMVNKIAQEIRTGTDYPMFIFQSPSKYSYTVDKKFKHCNNCGNEWKPFDWYDTLDYEWRKSFYKKFISHIEDRLKYTSTFEVYVEDVYKGFYAESMYKAIGDDIPLREWRKMFKSIFDK